jgi:hypothetical protein
MASADVRIDIAAEFTGKKAFKQAETASQKMERSVAKLGKQLLGVFAATKLISFGKTAAKAFAADEKAARSLALALANTGNAFASIEVEKFIADLQRTTGVLDDNLRPAFRTLLTATGDVKKSQDGLALALDIAAGTGKDLGAVSMALAKAYGFQTTALSRLGAGLSKATLASGDLDLITQALTDKFSGQALAAAEGYAGSMDRLAVASNNAKEIIGKDLLDSLALLSGPGGITKATGQMEDLATQIGNVVYGLASLTNKVKGLFNIEGFNLINLVPGLGGIFGQGGVTSKLGAFGASEKARRAGNPAQSPGQRKAIDKANADALKLAKTKNTLSKIDNDNTSRKLTLTGDQLALLELEKKFDVERIGLFSALNQATDGETKMRLLSLIAIHDQNAALAGQIKKAEETTDAMEAFRQAILASIRALLEKIALEQAKLLAALGITSSQTAVGSPSSYVGGTYLGPDTYQSALGDIGLSNKLNKMDQEMGTVVNISVQGSVTTERDLVSAITQGIYNNQASGIPINYNTAY